MKKIFLLILFLLGIWSSFAQEKQERIIFIFDTTDKQIRIKDENIYMIGNLSFKHYPDKNMQKRVISDSIKRYATTYTEFEKKLAVRKGDYLNFFSKFDFYIFIKETDRFGCLYQVESIWLLEDKIEN